MAECPAVTTTSQGSCRTTADASVCALGAPRGPQRVDGDEMNSSASGWPAPAAQARSAPQQPLLSLLLPSCRPTAATGKLQAVPGRCRDRRWGRRLLPAPARPIHPAQSCSVRRRSSTGRVGAPAAWVLHSGRKGKGAQARRKLQELCTPWHALMVMMCRATPSPGWQGEQRRPAWGGQGSSSSVPCGSSSGLFKTDKTVMNAPAAGPCVNWQQGCHHVEGRAQKGRQAAANPRAHTQGTMTLDRTCAGHADQATTRC